MTALSSSEKNQVAVNTIFVMLVISILSLGIIVSLLIMILRKKIKPIDSIVEAAQQIALG